MLGLAAFGDRMSPFIKETDGVCVRAKYRAHLVLFGQKYLFTCSLQPIDTSRWLHSKGGPIDTSRRLRSKGGPIDTLRRLHSKGGPIDTSRRLHSKGGPIDTSRRLYSKGGPIDTSRRLHSKGGPIDTSRWLRSKDVKHFILHFNIVLACKYYFFTFVNLTLIHVYGKIPFLVTSKFSLPYEDNSF